MKEVIIKYKNNKALEALKDLGKYLGFSVSDPSSVKEKTSINGVGVIEGDETIDFSILKEIFTKNKQDAATLRKNGWQRKE